MKERKSTKLSSEVSEQDSEKLPDVAPDDDEVFEPTKEPIAEDPEEGSKGSKDEETKMESESKSPFSWGHGVAQTKLDHQLQFGF